MTTTSTVRNSERSRILSEAFATGFGSDLIIRCGKQEWKVHKMVIGLASPVLKVMCAQEKWKEGLEGVIVIGNPDDGSDVSDDAAAINHMLHFIYNEKYTLENKQTKKTGKLLSFACMHAKLYALGEKYDLQKLKLSALSNFKHDIESSIWKDNDFCDTITMVYTTTPSRDRGLRDLIVAKLDSMKPDSMSEMISDHIISTPDLLIEAWKCGRKRLKSAYCKKCDGPKERTCNFAGWRTNVKEQRQEFVPCGKTFLACNCVDSEARCSAHTASGQVNGGQSK